jgi:hypothetical protein
MKLIVTPLRPRAGDPCPVCGARLGCQPETAGYPACTHDGCRWWPTREQQAVYEATPNIVEE